MGVRPPIKIGFYDYERYTSDITDAQLESIIRYCQLWNYDGRVYVNDRVTEFSVIKQADKLALRKIFSL